MKLHKTTIKSHFFSSRTTTLLLSKDRHFVLCKWRSAFNILHETWGISGFLFFRIFQILFRFCKILFKISMTFSIVRLSSGFIKISSSFLKTFVTTTLFKLLQIVFRLFATMGLFEFFHYYAFILSTKNCCVFCTKILSFICLKYNQLWNRSLMLA